MNSLHTDGCRNALTAASEEFEADMRRLKDALASADSTEAEEAIVQQMREREGKHRDLVASLQRSLF